MLCVENHRYGHLPRGHIGKLCRKDFQSLFLLFSFTVAQIFTAPTFSHVTPTWGHDPQVRKLWFIEAVLYGAVQVSSVGLGLMDLCSLGHGELMEIS